MIVDQSYWDHHYSSHTFGQVNANDPIKTLIRRFVPEGNGRQTAFEFGCFPGRYLLELGRRGYAVSGCDRTPRVETEQARWLASQNVTVGNFYKCNFIDTPAQKFDVVASFGFVEHFEDFADVFEFHFNFVKPGGIVFVTFPNFYGVVQRKLRNLLDPTNLKRHVIAAMNIENYHAVAKRYGQVVYSGYFGGFDFWVEESQSTVGPPRRLLLKSINKTKRLWPKIPSLSISAPYGGIIVRTPS